MTQLNDNKLLGFHAWRTLADHLLLRNELDFREREIALSFVWSRMRIVDERPLKAQAKLQQLSFEDFLELIVYLAWLKVIPTEEQVFEAGCEDAGDFMVQLLQKPEAAVNAFVQSNQRAWGEPLPGPVFRYVDSIVFYIIRRVESVLMNGQFQQDKGFKGALKLRDVERFQRMMLVNDR